MIENYRGSNSGFYFQGDRSTRKAKRAADCKLARLRRPRRLSRRIDPAARPPAARAGASPGPAISPTGTARGKCAAPRSLQALGRNGEAFEATNRVLSNSGRVCPLVESFGRTSLGRYGRQWGGGALDPQPVDHPFVLRPDPHKYCRDLVEKHRSPGWAGLELAQDREQMRSVIPAQRYQDRVDVVGLCLPLPFRRGGWRRHQLAVPAYQFRAEREGAAVDIIGILRAQMPSQIAAFVIAVKDLPGRFSRSTNAAARSGNHQDNPVPNVPRSVLAR